MALSESGEIRESTPDSQTPKSSRRPKPHRESEPITEIKTNPLLEITRAKVTSVPEETESVTEVKPRPPTPEPKPKAATLRTLSGGVSTGVSVESSEPRREPTRYEIAVAQAERSSVLAKERLLQSARRKIEQLMKKNQLKEIIAELDSILELGATIPSDLLDRLLDKWPTEMSPYEAGEKRPRARANPVGPARREPRIMSRPETPPASKQLESTQTPSGTEELDEDIEEKTEEIEKPVSTTPPVLTMPAPGMFRLEGQPTVEDDLELEDQQPTSQEPRRIVMPVPTMVKERPAEPGPVSDWEGPEPSTPPGGTTLSKLKWKERISRLRGFVNGLLGSSASEKISDAQAPRMTRADVAGLGETVAQMRQPTAAETTQPPAETRVQSQENNSGIEDEPTEESTPKKPGFLSRLFGRPKKPTPPPAPPAPPSAPPASPKPKGDGFLSNLLNSKLGKWGKRLAIIGLAARWGGHTTNETQDTESKSSGFPTEQRASTDFQQNNSTDFNREIFKLLQKEAALQEKLKIGTVGSDSEHNGLVKLVQLQLEHSPKNFGFQGDTSDHSAVSHWANELAKDTAKAHGITGLGGEWRLTSAAIGELSVLVDVGEDGRPAISYHNAHDGSLLKNDQLSQFFYQHDAGSHDTSHQESGEHGTKTYDIGNQNVNSVTGDQETVDFIHSDAAIERLNELQQLWEKATSLNVDIATNKQAFENWKRAANESLQLSVNDRGSNLNTSTREKIMAAAKELDEREQLITQELEASTQLEQTTKNLEFNIQHQEFARNLLRGEPIRRLYEKAFKQWQESASNQPISEFDAPDSTYLLEKAVENLARALNSQLILEQQKHDLSERMYQIKNPNKNLEMASLIYLTFFNNYQADLNNIVSRGRFDAASAELAEMQKKVEDTGRLLDSLLLLETYDDTLSKRVSQLKHRPEDIKRILAKYLVASRAAKNLSREDSGFYDGVRNAVMIGNTLAEDLAIIETMEAETAKTKK
ncbi:MAG: hypothetical protein V1716_05105 [Candidatus Uhrbacteria bacterium]